MPRSFRFWRTADREAIARDSDRIPGNYLGDLRAAREVIGDLQVDCFAHGNDLTKPQGLSRFEAQGRVAMKNPGQVTRAKDGSGANVPLPVLSFSE